MDAAELSSLISKAGADLSLLYGDAPVPVERAAAATTAALTVPSCSSSAVDHGRALARELSADAAAAENRATEAETAWTARSAELRQRWMDSVKPLGTSVFGRVIDLQTRQSATLCSSPAVRRTLAAAGLDVEGADVLSRRLGFSMLSA